MKLNWQQWLYGLVSAFIGGGAAAVTGGLTSIGIDPEHFNLQAGLKHTAELAGAIFVVSGAMSVALYLKQSPLPPPTP